MQLLLGDCLDRLKELPSASVDAVVTDPPYGLSFMGKKWDYDVPSLEVWQECLRVLKPGGHLLSFAGSRTYHRMAVRIEDAGFEIRDQIMWLYGSGFPKSLDVSKAIDKRGGNAGLTAKIGAAIKAAREARGLGVSECDRVFCGGTTNWSWFEGRPVGQRAPTPETFAKIAEAWPELAPLAEAVTEAQREVVGSKTANLTPYQNIGGENASGTVDITAPSTDAAKQWDGWGTALKPAHEPIVVARKPLIGTVAENVLEYGTGAINIDGCRVGSDKRFIAPAGNDGTSAASVAPINVTGYEGKEVTGRWPANLIHDGLGEDWARYFYCAKASKKDRDEGLEGLEAVERVRQGLAGERDNTFSRNSHPTVKPTELMRYLCRLITPPGGVVLDPFMGSGSTGKAAKLEGFDFIGIEREEDYMKIAEARINAV